MIAAALIAEGMAPTTVLGAVVGVGLGLVAVGWIVFALRRPPAPKTLDLTEVVTPGEARFEDPK